MNKTKNIYRDQKTGRYISSPAARSQQLLEELYRAFDHFNNTFAENKLPKVVITIQESGRRNAYGWFGNGFWTDRLAGDSVPEINLSAEYLSRGPNGLLETLLHEMAHLWNATVAKERDCTSGQYHNKHFKHAAQLFGLKVYRIKNKGFAGTSLDEAAYQAINELKPDDQVISSLKRKRVKKIYVKRYISLIVGAEYEETVNAGMKKYGMTQKQFVEPLTQRS